jgi:O-antigen/teichoic acid export membrane protein
MTILLGVAAAVLTAALAPVAVPLLFGAEFTDAAHVVALLVPGVVAMGVWRSIAPAIVRFGSLWTQPILAGSALAINVLANLALIRPFGAAGAAISSTVAYALVCVLSVRWILRRTGSRLAQLLPGRTDLGAIARALPGRT